MKRIGIDHWEVIDIYIIDDDNGRYYNKRGRGRPRKYNAKRNAHCVKLTDEEADMLEDLKEDMDRSGPDVFRYLLHDYYCEHYYGVKYREK